MLIDISPKGELLSDATRRSDIVTTSTKMEKKTKESIEKALNLLNIQGEKKEIILKEEQEKAAVELLSGKDVLAILPTGFGKSLIYTIFGFGEHRFAVCEDVCVSHLHSILHFSCTDIWRPPRVLKNIYRRNIWNFEEIAKFLFQIITTKSTHVAGGSFFGSWPAF